VRESLVSLLETEAIHDSALVLLTGDLGFSVLEPLQNILGDRFLNVGVSEANMASMAGALAEDGFHVYVYSIAPFLTLRCLEQIRNDISYGVRPVRLIGVGAGLSYGTLGPSHHSLEDANVMAQLPSMQIVSPATEGELRQAHQAITSWDFPIYFRIPRAGVENIPCPEFMFDAAVIKYRTGSGGTILTSGPSLGICLDAADELTLDGIDVTVISIPILNPFPTESALDLPLNGPIVTVFEGYMDNPLETALMKILVKSRRSNPPVEFINAGKKFADVVGDTDYLRNQFGLTANRISSAMRMLLENH
jgi:transketolase